LIILNLSTKIRFGSGVIEELFSSDLGRTVLLYSKSLPVELLEKISLSKAKLISIKGEPCVETINNILGADLSRYDQVIGVGGGSVMDAAKSLTACMELDKKNCRDLTVIPLNQIRTKIKLTLCPSTSGTGSELSKGAILYDEQSRTKKGIRGLIVLADSALVDPELTISCSRNVLMETGFDAFAHSVETFISKKSNFVTRELSLHAIKSIVQALPSTTDGDT
jgi:alcohol dehydrogenase class IV